jgi:hypothetical protein
MRARINRRWYILEWVIGILNADINSADIVHEAWGSLAYMDIVSRVDRRFAVPFDLLPGGNGCEGGIATYGFAFLPKLVVAVRLGGQASR